MKDLLSRIKYWIKKPASTNCHGFCLKCKWFDLCSEETKLDAIKCNGWKEYQMPIPTEFRCCICQNRYDCPAYETGVIFPCAYFKEEHHGTEE